MRRHLGLLLMLVCGSAQAYSLEFDELGRVSTIFSLEIDSVLLDVSFQREFGSETFFFGNETGANSAVDTINSVLNTTTPPLEVDYLFGNFYVVYYEEGFGGHAISIMGCSWRNCGSTSGLWENVGSVSPSGDTTFRLSAVPLPPAVLLFLSGLGVLGWMRRRRPTKG